MNISVIGDTHLGNTQAKAKQLLAYLDRINPEVLVLLGDILDLDAINNHKLPKYHLAVILKLYNFIESGTRVYYVTGNHDDGLHNFSEALVNNLHIRRELQLNYDGHKFFFFHGDRLDSIVKYKIVEDRWPKVFRKLVVKTDSYLVAIKRMFGRSKWSLAKEVQTNAVAASRYVEYFERAATRLAQEKACDHVICGHIHQPKIKNCSLHSQTIKYLNVGDWVTNLSALEYRFGKWTLASYSESNLIEDKSKRWAAERLNLPNIAELQKD